LYVDPFAFQGSHGLAALAEANALVVIPPGAEAVAAGVRVDVRVLRGTEYLL
jgi:molybdopterin biosynthesis enzyme